MSWLNRLKQFFGGVPRLTPDEAIKKYNIRVEHLPPPLTVETAACVPTSLLLRDLMWHFETCSGKCEHCQPKLVEIDRRLPVRNPQLVDLKP